MLNKDEKFLLYPAEGDIDEDEGLTREEMLEMLADELGYDLVKKSEGNDPLRSAGALA